MTEGTSEGSLVVQLGVTQEAILFSSLPPAHCWEVSFPAAVVATEQLECLVPQQLQLTVWYINLSHSQVQFVLMNMMICELW